MSIWNLPEEYPNFFIHVVAIVVAAAITGSAYLAGCHIS